MAYELTKKNPLHDDVCNLIKKTVVIDENGIERGEVVDKREVFCKIGGVYNQEFFNAYQSGIKARFMVTIFAGDYDNEKLVEYEGKIYEVYRRFQRLDDYELYLREDLGEWNE